MSSRTVTWEDTKRGHLILVTPEYGLSRTGMPKELLWIEHKGKGISKAASGNALEAGLQNTGMLLEQEAARMLGRLLSDIKSEGRIVLVSGYRSHEEQVRIWDDTLRTEGEAFTRTYVAKPGHSEHESGLAVDLAENRDEIDFICPEFPKEGICGTFLQRASGYGFVLRYPAGKKSITGIGEEPWHFRYVGVCHSRAMEQEGLILEEYVSFLKEDTSPSLPYLCFDPGEGACTEIFYLPMEKGEIRRFHWPKGAAVSLSGTNEGGVVICRRRGWHG